MSLREILLWTLIAALVFAGLAAHFGVIEDNDGYQYVSVAENISTTGHIATSLVYFDTEREHGMIPAPETTFPPGYSAVISLVSKLGPSRELAAEIVSILGAILVTLFLCKLCLAIGCSLNATRFAVCLWLASSYACAYSRSLGTESLFAAVITAAILLLVMSDQSLRQHGVIPFTLIWAFVLAGLSAWIRYAGLFIFCGFFLYALVLLLTSVRRKFVVWESLLAGGGIVASLLVRNIVLTSTWKGGNTKLYSNPFFETAWIGMRGFIKLVFGDDARIDIRIPLIGGCAIILLGAAALMNAKKRPPLSRPLYILTGLFCVYSALMLLAGMHTPINFGSRMFFPVLPLILAVLSWFLAWAVENVFSAGRKRQLAMISISVFTASYVIANTRSDIAALPPSPAATVRQQLAQLDDQGKSLRTWLESHLDSRTSIVAAEGQAAGYVLHRPTVSLVEHRFSVVDWTEPQVRQTMTIFRAQYLIVFPQADPSDAPSEYESPFLSSLTNRQCPDWLQIAESSPKVIVYQRVR
ncbi:MAG TPA: hypothetical protein VK699_11595 [Terriglobales bacterium]|jgi:hypothetical protein|nr:hypothetical protein [Terriglobales bacterium]